MERYSLWHEDADPDDCCDEIWCFLKKQPKATRFAPSQSLRSRYFNAVLLWTFLLIKCDRVNSFLSEENGTKQRQLQATPIPVSSPVKTYAARRINCGGENEYVDTNGVSWGADVWYGNIGRRTTPSECTADIINTTDDILYCSNRFYPVSMVDPPYRYNVPVPYSALYEVRLHFAEVTFKAVKKRIFNVLIGGDIAVKNLDVYAQAGAFAAYVVTLQVLVPNRTVTIQFVPIVDDPFISAIEVVEIPDTTAPTTIPSPSPIVVPSASPSDLSYAAVVRLNTGGETFVDSKGNTWSNDTFFQGNSVVDKQACTTGRDIENTVDDVLFCSERYFKGNSTSSLYSSYEIPVNRVAVYQIRLYFSENYFRKSGMRLFDVAVEEEVIVENFDIFESAGGPITLYVVSVVANVTDGYISVGFIPKVNYPTISAIEVLLVADNTTTTTSVSPSTSPTFDVIGQAVTECSAYAFCVDAGFTGNCCPLANGTTRECCSGKPELSLSPSYMPSNVPSDIISSLPSFTPTITKSFAPSVLVTTSATIKPSVERLTTTVPRAPFFAFNKTINSVSGIMMVLTRNTQVSVVALALDTNCTKIWQNAIQERIEAEVLTVIPMYETIDVNLFDVSRSSNVSHITMTFDIVIEIRSAVQDLDSKRFIQGPFDSQSEKINFVQYLATTGCPDFVNIDTIDVIIPSGLKADVEDDKMKDNEQWFLGLFIAVGAGCGAIVLGALMVICVRMKQRRKINEIDRESINPENIKEHRNFEGTPAEIDRSHDGTDISTLGDPIIPETLMKISEVDTSTVGSGGDEYDYRKAYLDLESISESNVGDAQTIISSRQHMTYSDDLHSVNDIVSTTVESIGDSFIPETEYSISAPPGLLGLILESNNIDGRPIVNSIKPFSALVNRVFVGDCLVSVDNEDVSRMAASTVSQLIASKQHQTRNLIFKRRITDDSVSNGVC